jgi:hypothetical protein
MIVNLIRGFMIALICAQVRSLPVEKDTVLQAWNTNMKLEQCNNKKLFNETSSFLNSACNFKMGEEENTRKSSLCFAVQFIALHICEDPQSQSLKLPEGEDENYCSQNGGILSTYHMLDQETLPIFTALHDGIKDPVTCGEFCSGQLLSVCKRLGTYGNLFLKMHAESGRLPIQDSGGELWEEKPVQDSGGELSGDTSIKKSGPEKDVYSHPEIDQVEPMGIGDGHESVLEDTVITSEHGIPIDLSNEVAEVVTQKVADPDTNSDAKSDILTGNSPDTKDEIQIINNNDAPVGDSDQPPLADKSTDSKKTPHEDLPVSVNEEISGSLESNEVQNSATDIKKSPESQISDKSASEDPILSGSDTKLSSGDNPDPDGDSKDSPPREPPLSSESDSKDNSESDSSTNSLSTKQNASQVPLDVDSGKIPSNTVEETRGSADSGKSLEAEVANEPVKPEEEQENSGQLPGDNSDQHLETDNLEEGEPDELILNESADQYQLPPAVLSEPMVRSDQSRVDGVNEEPKISSDLNNNRDQFFAGRFNIFTP